MNLKVTGELIVYVASMAILLFACLQDMNTGVRPYPHTDGAVVSQGSVLDQR